MNTKTANKDDKESPKGEHPCEEKLVGKIIEEQGKTFRGKGREVRK